MEATVKPSVPAIELSNIKSIVVALVLPASRPTYKLSPPVKEVFKSSVRA